jgi:hypothetical protein
MSGSGVRIEWPKRVGVELGSKNEVINFSLSNFKTHKALG